VSTTSDPGAVASGPFTVVPAGTLSAVTVANATPSSGAGARTVYVVDFKTSSTGALSVDANSRWPFTFPAGTTFAGWGGGTIRDVTRAVDIGNCGAPSGLNVTCSLFTNAFAAAGDALRVTFSGVANPASAGADKTVSVSTTSDPQAIASAPFSVVAGGVLSGVAVSVASLAPSTRTRYVVRFTTSATGGLSTAANSRFDVTFPAARRSPVGAAGACSTSPAAPSSATVARRTGSSCNARSSPARSWPRAIQLQTTFGDITNPAAAGPYKLSVATHVGRAGDPASSNYTQASRSRRRRRSVPARPARSRDTSATFEFDSPDANATFECSLDGDFAPCTSPKGTAGSARARTRSACVQSTSRGSRIRRRRHGRSRSRPRRPRDPHRGTHDLTDAGPDRHRHATATPQPEFKQDVVVAPAGGTVEICDKPGFNCVMLIKGAEVPLNKTIDARKGAVRAQLDRRGRQGRDREVLRRHVQGLPDRHDHGPDPQRAARPLLEEEQEGERLGGKKPKSRKLWGDGKGKFRTKGSYSAATVRAPSGWCRTPVRGR
jgi:hypothetical protein